MPQAETPAALERKNMKNIRVNRIGRKEELPTRWGRLSAAFDQMIRPGSWPVRAIQNVILYNVLYWYYHTALRPRLGEQNRKNLCQS